MKVNCLKCNTENEISAEKLSNGRATISCHKCGNKIKISTISEERAESTINVKCPKCNAVYKILSNKIPKHGAKSVCTKCGNEIWITKNIGKKRTYVNGKDETNRDGLITKAPLTPSAFDFMLFVGQKYDKYAKKFTKFSKNGKDSYALTWHWPAFFIPVYWFSYRKLYWWALFAFLFSIIPVLNIVVKFCWAMTGNYIYYKHAGKKIREAKMEHCDLSTELKTIGGINKWILFVIVPIMIGLFSAVAIPNFIAYKERADSMTVSDQKESRNHRTKAIEVKRTTCYYMKTMYEECKLRYPQCGKYDLDMSYLRWQKCEKELEEMKK